MGETAPSASADRVLLVVAVPAEARAVILGLKAGAEPPPPWSIAVLDDRFDLVVTGVGKACAAGAVATVLKPGRHRACLNVGVAGALPGSGLTLGEAVLASASVFADEGVQAGEGFTDLAAMGFPPPGLDSLAVPASEGVSAVLRPLAAREGPIATVSTCSGTDALAAEVAGRTGALAEAMEGAAAGYSAWRAGVPFGELRVISNTTGNRSAQVWDLRGSLARLAEVLGQVRHAGL